MLEKIDFAKNKEIGFEVRACGSFKSRAKSIKTKKRWEEELLGDHLWRGWKWFEGSFWWDLSKEGLGGRKGEDA